MHCRFLLAVYAAQAPSRLPPLIILRHVVLTLLACVRMVARVLLVGFVWLAALPYSVLWAWRGFFHLGKSWGVAWNAVAQEADWSRMALSSLLLPRAPKGASASDTDAAMKQLAQSVADLKATWEAMASRASGTPGKDAVHVHSMSTTGHLVSSSLRPRITSLDEVFRDFMRVWHRPADIPHAASASPSASVAPSLPAVVVNLAAEAVVDAEQHATTLPRAFAWRLLMAQHEYINEVVHGFWHRHQDTLQRVASALYQVGPTMSTLTCQASSYRIMAKDCFSGQIIVCCVVVAFIAAFLLREWVLSNQPLAEGEPMPANGAGAAPGNLPLALPPPLLQDPPAENVDAIPDATEALAGESRPRTRPGSPWPREALDAADLEAEEDAELDDTKMKSASSDAVEAQAGPSSEGAQAFLQRQRERNASTHSSVPAGQAFPAGNPPQQDGQFRFQFSVEDGELQNQDGSDQVVQAGAARSDDEWVDADDVQDEEQPAFGPAPQSAVQGGPAALAPAAVRPDPAAVAAVNQRARRRAVRRQRRRLGLPEDPRDFGESDSSDSEFEDDPFNMGRRPGEAVNDAAANELADPRAADRAIGGIAPDEQAAIDALRDEEEMFWEADLEGIMEAVGLRGPLIALLQNVGLMTLLVTSLLAVAVWMPLMLGKTVVAVRLQRCRPSIARCGRLIQMSLHVSSDQRISLSLPSDKSGPPHHRPGRRPPRSTAWQREGQAGHPAASYACQDQLDRRRPILAHVPEEEARAYFRTVDDSASARCCESLPGVSHKYRGDCRAHRAAAMALHGYRRRRYRAHPVRRSRLRSRHRGCRCVPPVYAQRSGKERQSSRAGGSPTALRHGQGEGRASFV